jgi:hypothetical protein
LNPSIGFSTVKKYFASSDVVAVAIGSDSLYYQLKLITTIIMIIPFAGTMQPKILNSAK